MFVRGSVRCVSSVFPNFAGHPSLVQLGIRNPRVYRNLSVAELYEAALDSSLDHAIPYKMTSTGALAAYPGPPPPRPPGHKRIVSEASSENDVWWGPSNIPISTHSYDMNLSRCMDFMNYHPQLFVVDGFTGWHPSYRLPVRVICTEVHHALFATIMLIKPQPDEWETHFSKSPYLHIFQAGRYPANSLTTGVTTSATLDIHLGDRTLLIMGVQQIDEMKKALFSALHYFLPKRRLLPLHASATVGEMGDVTLMFGLSGSGKTVLSHRTTRRLICDDENCWGNDGIFSLEGGCLVGITRNNLRDVPSVALFGGLLENPVLDSDNNVEYADHSTVSYPVTFLPSAQIPCFGAHPKNLIMLVRDTFGVLPPVSKLTSNQALYHFIAGYNGTWANGKASADFSACFGTPFLVESPVMYADMLSTRISKHNTKCWLINSGWTGGAFGKGHRMTVDTTNRILNAIHSGQLNSAPTEKLDIFGLDFPVDVPGLNPDLQTPWKSWENVEEYKKSLQALAMEFKKQTRRYEDLTAEDVKAAGPKL